VRRAPLFALVVVIAGCAASIQDRTKTQYVNPAFGSVTLQAGGLALFPVTAGQGQEGYRRPLGDFLNDSLQVAVPGGSVLSWHATMDSLNQHGKVDAYEGLVAAYAQTSIVHREKAKEIGEAIGVRYALFCSLQRAAEVSNTSYSIWTGWNTTNTVDVIAHCLVVDLQTGDVIQEIMGQAMSVGGSSYYNSPYEAYAQVLAQSVLSQLPGSAVSPPQPAKRKSSKKLSERSRE
jgi:hypothetical protein